jgi:hypothetical protein
MMDQGYISLDLEQLSVIEIPPAPEYIYILNAKAFFEIPIPSYIDILT